MPGGKVCRVTAALAAGAPGCAAVASGNAATTAAAVHVLESGGNAVDAAIAAGFASTVSEPGLTSMAGGGFLLVRHQDGSADLLDFFSAVPGLGLERAHHQPTRITVVYPSAQQDFHVGPASAAVPGNLSGFLVAHSRFGRLPIADVVAPSVRLAAAGARIDRSQAYILELIEPIVWHSDAVREVYAPGGQLLRDGDVLTDLDLAAFLQSIAAGSVDSLTSPGFARPLLAMADEGCAITEEDLLAFRALWREPLLTSSAGWHLLTNPPPAFGGQIVARTFAEAGSAAPAALTRTLARITDEVKDAPAATLGTTHVSVVDADGLMVSMTTTNGAGGGVIVPGTGVHLNNMMGEDDLLPAGRDAAIPGERLRSMIAPTILTAPDGTITALGSGGSARIRTAIATVVSRLRYLDEGLAEAISAPRAHRAEDGTVQAEGGMSAADVTALRTEFDVNAWSTTDFYFGGVNAVQRHPDGAVTAAADHRRNGTVAIVSSLRT